jgi:hypothetical protein
MHLNNNNDNKTYTEFFLSEMLFGSFLESGKKQLAAILFPSVILYLIERCSIVNPQLHEKNYLATN